MRVRWLALLSCFVGVCALGFTACGSSDDSGGSSGSDTGSSGGDTVDIYSSLPLQGAQRTQTTALVNGIKLALDQAGSKAGDLTVKYTPLDDSTAQAGAWTPEAASANARKVAQDDKSVAYIGEFNSGASAITIPLLNEVPIAQVSPANTAVGLTTDDPGADKGEPDKYYPTGQRHYLRIVPKDTIQGAALATIMKKDGCQKAYILNDKEVYGAGLAKNIELAAKDQGLTIAGDEGIDPKAPNFRSQAATVKSSGADCFVFSGITANGAVQLYKDISAAVPDAKLYGPDGVAESGFVDPKEGGIPADVANKVKLSVATLAPDQYSAAGQKFFKDFSAKYNEAHPDPYAIYGYEAMKLILDTCTKIGADCTDRQALIDALFQTKGRDSVLGTYDIDKNGDTTLTDYGIYTVKDGDLVFGETVKAQGG